MAEAASGGHIETLQWLYNNGGDASGCTRQLDSHKEFISAIRKRKWNVSMCEVAAEHGHTNVLNWAKQNNIQISPYCYSMAAYNGHIHVLQWLLSQKILADFYMINSAIEGQHITVFKWIKDNFVDNIIL